jgi:serine phosphatase RsbU (regulator of sigma subunit)/DNA-binding NarL/FixJ family response regulator
MKINILVVEDNSDELFLILRCLSKTDFEVTHLLVDCAQDLTEALDNGNWDVILSDYNIPGFGGAEALQICNSINNTIPFILVSGTIGEETAVSLIKAGAKDYIMKNNLARLPEVIKREIKDAQLLVERNILIEKSNKLSMIVESSPDIVLNFDKNESINYYNKAANELLQLNDYHSENKLLTEMFSPYWHNFFQSTVLPHLYKFEKWEGELNFKKTDLSELPVLASIVKHSGPEVDEFSIIATNITERKAQEMEIMQLNANLEKTVKLRTEQLIQSNADLEQINKEITDSIKYAKHLQNAILPTHDYIEKLFPNHFIFYKPKDIVSGDFYWFEEFNDKIIFSAVDCTGHGVPGAFMSIVGYNLLNLIVNIYGITKPNLILEALNKGVKNKLSQTLDDYSVQDGMDIAICSYDVKTSILEFAGAYNGIWLIRDNQIEEIKANKHAIGLFIDNQSINFTNHEVKIQKGDIVYLYTDGYADQFGGPRYKKFKYKQLKEIIYSNRNKEMLEQRNALQNELQAWQGDFEQTDDILIMGIKF